MRVAWGLINTCTKLSIGLLSSSTWMRFLLITSYNPLFIHTARFLVVYVFWSICTAKIDYKFYGSTITWLVDNTFVKATRQNSTSFQSLQCHAREQTLRMVVFCALPVHNSLNPPSPPFSHATVTCMWPLDHMPYTALASNWLTNTTWAPSWFVFHSKTTK